MHLVLYWSTNSNDQQTDTKTMTNTNDIIVQPAQPISFYSASLRARSVLYPQLGLNLAPLSFEDCQAHQGYLAPGGRAGFAVSSDGELINLWSYAKGQGRSLVRQAIEKGAKHLNCFDGHLPSLYASQGFVETDRLPFDWQYAPKGWKASYGEPDVVVMKLI